MHLQCCHDELEEVLLIGYVALELLGHGLLHALLLCADETLQQHSVADL